MGTNPLVELGRLGQSPWYDFITRDLIASGTLAEVRCQSRSCLPMSEACIQTPGSMAGYRAANSGRSFASRILPLITLPPSCARAG